jgi:hypothetical protein
MAQYIKLGGILTYYIGGRTMEFKRSKKVLLGATIALSSVLSIGSVLMPMAQVQAAVVAPPVVNLGNAADILASSVLGVSPMYSSNSIGDVIAALNGNVAYYINKNIGYGGGSSTKYLAFAYYDVKTNTTKTVKTDSYYYSGSSAPPTIGFNGRYLAMSNVGLTSVTLYDTVTGTSKYIGSLTGQISNGVRITVTDNLVVFGGSSGKVTVYDIAKGTAVAKTVSGSYVYAMPKEGAIMAVAQDNGGIRNQLALTDLNGVTADVVAYRVTKPSTYLSQMFFVDKDNLVFCEYTSAPYGFAWYSYNLQTKKVKALAGFTLNTTVKESNGYLVDGSGNVYSLAADKTVRLTGPNYPYNFALAGDFIYSARSMTSTYNGDMHLVRYKTSALEILPPLPQQDDLQTQIDDLNSQLGISTTKVQLDAVQTQLNGLQEQLNAAPASADKDAQQASLNIIQNTLSLRYATLAVTDAENAVKGDLSTQTLIDNATVVYNTALAKVNSLPAGTGKTQLQTRLAVVSQTLETAQNVLNAVNGVSNATTVSNVDLTSQPAITTAKQAILDAQALVNKLSAGDLKTSLQTALDTANAKVQLAQDILNAKNGVANATTTSNADLTPQTAIDAAKQAITTAQVLVDKLPSSDLKTDLQSQLNVNQVKVDTAQALLNVSTAEQTKTQSAVDAATSSVSKVQDATLKSELTQRLVIVQQYININKSLDGILSTDLNTYASVTQAVYSFNVVKPVLSVYPAGVDKDVLTSKYNQVLDKIGQSLVTLLNEKEKGKKEDLSDVSLHFLVEYAIKQVGATSIQDRGKIHGFVMPLLHGKATGNDVNQIIDSILH